MNEKEKKEPKMPLKIDLPLEEVLADMLTIKPPTDQQPQSVKKAQKGKKKILRKK